MPSNRNIYIPSLCAYSRRESPHTHMRSTTQHSYAGTYATGYGNGVYLFKLFWNHFFRSFVRSFHFFVFAFARSCVVAGCSGECSTLATEHISICSTSDISKSVYNVHSFVGICVHTSHTTHSICDCEAHHTSFCLAFDHATIKSQHKTVNKWTA